MTPEEAKIVIGNMPIKPEVLDDCYSITEYQEAKTIAIKALEQQLCEDCVNRKEVNVLVDELARAISDERCFMSRGRSTANIMQDILDLPSVTPTRPTARWSRQTDTYHDYYECENCGIGVGLDDVRNFCPNCGAKMEEIEE